MIDSFSLAESADDVEFIVNDVDVRIFPNSDGPFPVVGTEQVCRGG